MQKYCNTEHVSFQYTTKTCKKMMPKLAAPKGRQEGTKGRKRKRRAEEVRPRRNRKESGEVYLPLKGGTPSMTPARRVSKSFGPPWNVIFSMCFCCPRSGVGNKTKASGGSRSCASDATTKTRPSSCRRAVSW